MSNTSETPFRSSFIYDSFEKTPSCHSIALVALPGGDVFSAWFGGQKEFSPDSAHYCAWWSKKTESWSPVSLLWDVPEKQAGNPRLCFDQTGLLWAILPINDGKWCNGGGKFYCRASADQGATWSDPVHYPELDLLLGKNKPLLLPSGEMLIPVDHELDKTSSILRFTPATDQWRLGETICLPNGARCLQPALVPISDNRLLAFLRSDTPRIWKTISSDGGRSWGNPQETDLRHNDSGVDVVRLQSGRILLVFNDVADREIRTPLSMAVSEDEGETWSTPVVLDDADGDFSYPAVIQSGDGTIHVAYTYFQGNPRRVRQETGAGGTHMKHVRFTEDELMAVVKKSTV